MQSALSSLFLNILWTGMVLALVSMSISMRMRMRMRKRRKICKNVFMVVLGSGGHTAEMMQILRSMDWKTVRAVRCYVVAETDRMSGEKANGFEQRLAAEGSQSHVVMEYIPRSREVGQRYVTSVWTTLVALWSGVSIVMRHMPDVLLVNGPGTVFYVESIARVDHLSLTGRIIYRFGLANGGFYVQWKELHEKLKNSIYAGRVY